MPEELVCALMEIFWSTGWSEQEYRARKVRRGDNTSSSFYRADADSTLSPTTFYLATAMLTGGSGTYNPAHFHWWLVDAMLWWIADSWPLQLDPPVLLPSKETAVCCIVGSGIQVKLFVSFLPRNEGRTYSYVYVLSQAWSTLIHCWEE